MKRNKKKEKAENEREMCRLLIIEYSYMCEHCDATCGVALFTNVHQIYFRYEVANQMEEVFSIMLCIIDIQWVIHNPL
jgi:hypothetical protein